MRPVICFNLDGTLLDGRGGIHPADRMILAGYHQIPVHFVAVTGRPLGSVRHALRENGLFPGGPIPIGLVLLNGALVLGPGEALVEQAVFPPETQHRLVETALRFPRVSFLFIGRESVHRLHETAYGVFASEMYRLDARRFSAHSGEVRFSQLLCLSPDPALLLDVQAAFAGLDLEGMLLTPTMYELLPKGVNKAAGLSRLLDSLGESGSPVFAAGDGGNDLPLFDLAWRAFAPMNSPQTVRAAADAIIDTRVDGVLAFILQRIRQRGTGPLTPLPAA